MKLRIRGSSLRFRLSQGDVEALNREGSISDGIQFPNGTSLAYTLQAEDGEMRCDFDRSRISVKVPAEQVRIWASDSMVGIYGGHQNVAIAIEKDYRCLTERSGEEDRDTFPNPNTSC